MEFSIVENLSGLQESIFNLSRGPQVHFGEKSKNWSNFVKFIDFPLFPHLKTFCGVHPMHNCEGRYTIDTVVKIIPCEMGASGPIINTTYISQGSKQGPATRVEIEKIREKYEKSI